jgi:hypothetical protein
MGSIAAEGTRKMYLRAVQSASDFANNYADGCVYFNSNSGITGTAYPVGTATNPVNNFADAKAILLANKLTKLIISSGLNIAEDCFNGLEIEARPRNYIWIYDICCCFN